MSFDLVNQNNSLNLIELKTLIQVHSISVTDNGGKQIEQQRLPCRKVCQGRNHNAGPQPDTNAAIGRIAVVQHELCFLIFEHTRQQPL